MFPEPVAIDSVWHNGKPLVKTSIPYEDLYNDTLTATTNPPFVWKIKGSAEYPSFTESMWDTIPSFDLISQLPDSVSISAVTQVNLASSHADSVTFMLSDGAWSYGGTVAATATTFTMSNPNLSVTFAGQIYIMCYKRYFKVIAGKTMGFHVYSTYRKTIKLVN